MSNGGSIDLEARIDILSDFDKRKEDLIKFLSCTREGTCVLLSAKTPQGSVMFKIQIPTVEMSRDVLAVLEKELISYASDEGLNLRQADVSTVTRLFPESGEINFEAKYKPKYETPFRTSMSKVEVLIGSPSAAYR